jgi:tripartite-type tricarboxylate transporter receptor subunit TctC
MFAGWANPFGGTLAVMLAAVPAGSSAQEFPSKPMRFIVPSPGGASNDVAARVIAERLAAKWKQPVVVDNRPGAGTIIGTDAVAKAPPDGYTFGWVISALSITPSLYAKLPYDTANDLAGVTLVYQLKPVILTTPGLPVATVSDLIALAKAKPGQLSYASPATGTGVHLVGELFKLKHHLDMPHIGYKGAFSAYPDVISGRVPVMFDTLPGALPQIRAGKLKLLAVVSEGPVPGHPDFPVLSGLLPKEAIVGWNGLVVPAKTPRTIVAKLNADIDDVIRSPEVQERFASYSVQTITSTPQEFDAFIRADIVRWADVIKRAGIKLEQGS